MKLRHLREASDLRPWFGASKVVDEQGQPLVVYHGTPNRSFTDITQIRTRRSKAVMKQRLGAYFTPDRDMAERQFGHAHVHPAYLRMLNPFDLREKSQHDLIGLAPWLPSEARFNIKRDRNYPIGFNFLEQIDATFDLVPGLKRAGHDGIIFGDEIEGDTYVVFSASQVRSACSDLKGKVIAN